MAKKKKKKVAQKAMAFWKPALLLGILTTLVYSFSIGNSWVNWDDPDYVLQNIAVQNFDLAAIWTGPQAANYHPLTMMSLAFDWMIAGDKAWMYHFHNLLLHAVSSLVLFYFMFLLTGRKMIWAFVVAMGFALHPMHVESVAWISERKDVLYGLYFFLSLLSYLSFLRKADKKFYFLAIVLAVCSLLSKPSAMVLPFLLILIDWWEGKNWKSLLLNKLPILIAALAVAIITFSVQSDQAVNEFSQDGFMSRILYASYGFSQYVIKFFIPACLCAFYSYPVTETLPSSFYLYLVLALSSLPLVWYFGVKKQKRFVLFGFLFFAISLGPVLQLVSVGSAIMADRYSYVAHVGLLFILGALIQDMKKNSWMIAGIIALLWSALSISQIKHWKDGGALWNRVEECSPFPNPMIQQNKASFLRESGDTKSALKGINEALKMNPKDLDLIVNRANIYFDEGNFDAAKKDYDLVLAEKPDYEIALQNRGALLASKGKYQEALRDLNAILDKNPQQLKALSYRALSYYYLGDMNKASTDYRSYLDLDPSNHEMWSEYALVLRAKSNPKIALQAIDQALILEPKNPNYLVNAAIIYLDLEDLEKARAFAFKAQQLGGELSSSLTIALKVEDE